MKRMKWSFAALFEGKWPTRDDQGSNIRGGGDFLNRGYRGILYLLKGDLDYLSKTLGLPNCGSTNPCTWCPANLTNIPWWDLRPGCEWGKQLYTAGIELAGVCELFRVPGVTLMSVCPDWMHNKNLGTDMYFYGSVIWLLVYKIMGQSPEENLLSLENDLKKAYGDRGIPCRFQRITLSSLAQFNIWSTVVCSCVCWKDSGKTVVLYSKACSAVRMLQVAVTLA